MPGWIERGITPFPSAPMKRRKAGSKRPSTTAGREPPADLPAALRKLKIKHYDRDILSEMTLEEIREHFGYKPKAPTPPAGSKASRKKKKPRKPKSEFKIEILVKNVIWQVHEQIAAGQTPEFYKKRGTIRGLWYHMKTKLHRHKPLRGDFYSTIIKMMVDMVLAGVVSYRDFAFTDIDEGKWHLGLENSNAIIVCEKDGFVTYAKEYRDTYGCCAVTMGGSPSLMSVDYFTQRMVAAGIDLTQKFVVVSIVDFDPKGEDAANDFIDKLKLFGIRNLHRFRQYGAEYERLDLMQPKFLFPNGASTVGQVYNLPKTEWDSELGRSWFSRTRGVDGNRKLGVESDVCPGERIHELLVEHLVPQLKTSLELVQRRNKVRALRRVLSNILIYKQTGVIPDDIIRKPKPGGDH